MRILSILAAFVFLLTVQVDATVLTIQGTPTDSATGSAVMVDYAHHETHDGDHFSAHYNNDVTNTGEMTCIGFNTPNSTEQAHMIWSASASAAASFVVYRSPSIDVNEGTDLAVYNRNENSSNTSILTSVENPAVAGNITSYNETQAAGANITTTTTIYHEDIGRTGSPVSSQGGATRGSSEVILKSNTQYAICLVADDDNDNTHNIILDWYEHTRK
ncbi:MAG: hypothetical protein ACWGN1_02195 [Desulfobulbales bacterium]